MYARVECQFWDDPLVRRLSEDARNLLLYFFTTPHRNIIGLYIMPDAYAIHHLQWTPGRYRKALAELIERNRVMNDEDNSLILVLRHFRYNPLENPNQVKSAVAVLKSLPDTPLLGEFWRVCELYHRNREKVSVEIIKRYLSTKICGQLPFRNPFETVLKPDPDPNPNTDPETDPDPSADSGGASPRPPVPPVDEPVMAEVRQVVEYYNTKLTFWLPRVEALTETRKKVVRARIRQVGLAGVLAVIDMVAKSKFLRGLTPPSPGRKQFRASFDWIINESNFAKIREGNYNRDSDEAPQEREMPPALAGLARLMGGENGGE